MLFRSSVDELFESLAQKKPPLREAPPLFPLVKPGPISDEVPENEAMIVKSSAEYSTPQPAANPAASARAPSCDASPAVAPAQVPLDTPKAMLPLAEMPVAALEPPLDRIGPSVDDNVSPAREAEPEESIFQRRRREQSERKNPKPATAAVAVPSPAYMNAVKLIDQLERPNVAIPAEEREGQIGAALGALMSDSGCSLGMTCQIAGRLSTLAPAEYAHASMQAVHRGLLFQMMVNPCEVSAMQRCVAMLRPALIHELGLKDIAEIAELDAGLAGLSDHARFSAAYKLESMVGGVISGKGGAVHVRMSAAAQSSMRHFQSVLASLKNRRSTGNLSVHARGNVNMLIQDVSQPLQKPRDSEGEGSHGKQ